MSDETKQTKTAAETRRVQELIDKWILMRHIAIGTPPDKIDWHAEREAALDALGATLRASRSPRELVP